MQLFPCPFCGSRDEREFLFAGEAGKTRPMTTGSIAPQAWASYQFDQVNPKGESAEIWMHLPCSEMFVMQRDTVTMAVLGVKALRKASQ